MRERLGSLAAGVAGVFAVVSLLVGGSGLWTLWVAFDSDRFERRVDEVLAIPEVSDAIAARVVDDVTDAIGVRDAIVDQLPDGFEPAADLVLAGARTFVVDRVGEVLRRDEVRSVVAAAAGQAHAGAVEVIRGGSLVDGVRVVDDEVRLDVFPVVGVALGWLQELGLLRGVELPSLTREAGPEANRAALAASLGRELPPDFGELVVYRSDEIERAGTLVDTVQRLLVVSARLSLLTVAAGVAAAIAAVVLARRRARAVGLLAAAVAAEVVLVHVVTDRVAARVPSLVEGVAGRVAIAEFVDDLQRSLVRTTALFGATVVVVLVAIVLALGRWRSAPDEPT